MTRKDPFDTYAEPMSAHAPRKLFDITCVVGTVYDSGDPMGPPPHILAFQMIGEHGADGEYTFPDLNGNVIHVTVETEAGKPLN